MGRYKQCKGCVYFKDRIGNPIYDGWCEENEEERDHDERICDWYIPRPKEKPRKTRKKLSSKLYSV